LLRPTQPQTSFDSCAYGDVRAVAYWLSRLSRSQILLYTEPGYYLDG